MITKPSVLTVNPNAIPAELRRLPAWIGWRLVLKKHEWSKVPVNVRTGELAESNNPDTWTDFDCALAGYKRLGCDGIGLCRTDDLIFIDLDGVIDCTGSPMPYSWASRIMSTIQTQAYVELSVTGTGVHAICRGILPPGRRQMDVPDLHHTGFAFYDKARFFTFTGSVLPQSGQIQDLTQQLGQLHRELFPQTSKAGSVTSTTHVAENDSGLIARARRAKNGMAFSQLFNGDWKGKYASQSEADMALCCHLAFWTGRDASRIDALFRLSGLYRQDKWERSDYRERTIAAAIERTGETYAANIASMRATTGCSHAEGEVCGSGAPDLLHGYDPEDVGNGQRFKAMFGDMARWCPELQKWLIWDDSRWKVDDSDQVRALAQRTMAEFGVQASKSNNDSLLKFAAISRRSARITNALREAQPHIALLASELDTDPWLLNFKNGTVDLRTGELMPHDRSNYISKMIEHNFDPTATCPLFLRFLQRITGGGPEATQTAGARSARVILFLQRAFGYSLTGVTSEKVVFVLHGVRDNGKSTLLALFLKLLGPYAVLLQIESLMARPQETNNAQADLADLKGARFVMTSETEDGQRLAEGKLKRITQGTGRIKAVRKYENPIDFPESHKLWIDCNFLPVLRGHDKALWRRLRTIPFEVVIPIAEQDRQLSSKLQTEAEGILAWAVQGALDWHTYGLPPTPEIEHAAEEWRREADQIERFIRQCCTIAPNAQVGARTLYLAYRKWAEESGESAEAEKIFCSQMLERNFMKNREERGNVYVGIGLLAD